MAKNLHTFPEHKKEPTYGSQNPDEHLRSLLWQDAVQGSKLEQSKKSPVLEIHRCSHHKRSPCSAAHPRVVLLHR